MEIGVKQRLKEFIKTLRISDREFCRRIGTSTSFVNSIRKSVQPDKLKAITENFPELNPIWLMTGEGEMLLRSNLANVRGENNTTVAGNGNNVSHNDMATLLELQKGYQAMLKEKDEQINRLISVIEKLSAK